MPLPAGLRVGGYDFDPRHLYGVALVFHPGDATYEVEIQRAPDSGGAPDTGNIVTIGERLPASLPYFVDVLPDDGLQRWYRMRHTDARGETAGDWTEWQAATPQPVTPEAITTNAATPKIEALQASIAAADAGVLASTARIRTGGKNAKRIAKGGFSGTGKNGDTITFPEALVYPPRLDLEGGITYEPRSGQWSGGTYSTTLPQYRQLEAVNKSPAGFTLRARLMQKGTRTARSHNFTASNSLTAAGQSTALTLANAPAADDTYYVHCSIALTVTNSSGAETWGELLLAIDTSPDGSTWTTREVRPYSVADLTGGSGTTLTIAHEILGVAVTGLTSTAQVRVRVIALTLYGDPGTISCAVHAFDGTSDPDSGVTYETGTDVLASMTPDTNDYVAWALLEAVA